MRRSAASRLSASGSTDCRLGRCCRRGSRCPLKANCSRATGVPHRTTRRLNMAWLRHSVMWKPTLGEVVCGRKLGSASKRSDAGATARCKRPWRCANSGTAITAGLWRSSPSWFSTTASVVPSTVTIQRREQAGPNARRGGENSQSRRSTRGTRAIEATPGSRHRVRESACRRWRCLLDATRASPNETIAIAFRPLKVSERSRLIPTSYRFLVGFHPHPLADLVAASVHSPRNSVPPHRHSLSTSTPGSVATARAGDTAACSASVRAVWGSLGVEDAVAPRCGGHGATAG